LRVFVLDQNRQPLNPCSPAQARELLRKGRAAVLRRFPFTIILKDRIADPSTAAPYRLKIDPGSKVTGIAIVQENTCRVIFAAEIEHRGLKIKAAMMARRAVRRSRRQRKMRYRPRRFQNRRCREGRLPPSLESRLANILTWVERLRRACPIAALSQELVRFDTQAMEDPEIRGVEYQHGTLAGYECREYLLEKWQRRCAYCGRSGVPLQIDHIHAKSRGGSDRISNCALACAACNLEKGKRDIAEFLRDQPDVLEQVLAQAKAPLRDAASVNATRWELFRRLQATGLPVETGTGGRTKFNRARQGLAKAHWLDAACVGASTPQELHLDGVQPLRIRAYGHGRRNRCWTDRHGFPVRHAPRKKYDRGFRTGDLVEAVIPTGKYRGRLRGRVMIRFGQSFQVGLVSVHPRHLRKLHRADGYGYAWGEPFIRNLLGSAARPHA
jgi:5-methylcytosine-specific restriction endonuclease McrA